jgi:peptide/nickel transport system substrate-binding protein
MFPIRRSSPLLALGATAAILFSACGGSTATASPSASPAASTSASASAAASPSPTAAFAPMTYPDPAKGAVTCASGSTAGSYNNLPYSGEFKQIKAIDAKTVEFDLCAPDVAFLSKIAFDSFEINSAAYLAKAVPDGSIVQKPNGAGPYMVKEWVKGDHITLVANPNYSPSPYLAAPKVQTVVIKWSAEAAARLVDLQSGSVDGIDNVGPTDFSTVANDATLKLYPRPGLNTLYLGMNHDYAPWDNVKVRQAIAMGIDRSRIVKNFYPGGSEVADYFTPCGIANGCAGDPWYTFDPVAAKKLLADAGFPNGFSTTLSYRSVVRSYLPQPDIVAQDIQAQLKANLNITAKLDVQESTTFIDNSDAGKIKGLFLLGWGVDYPDQTDFVDYHFAGGTKAFGALYPDLVTAIRAAAQGANDDARKPLYVTVNGVIKQDVPMVPIAHGSNAVAFKADVDGAHASPLGDEEFAVMSPAGRDQLVFEQNAEPGGLYCADETDGESLRVCHNFGASLMAYKTAGATVVPGLASACTPNSDLTVWTCTLRDGVKFADGTVMDANDVVTSFAVQWDVANPLHKARTGDFSYFSGFFAGFLNQKPS